MSVDNYKYQCDHCGHTENQCEGIYLFQIRATQLSNVRNAKR